MEPRIVLLKQSECEVKGLQALFMLSIVIKCKSNLHFDL